jgi:hypothetical protein
MKYNVIFELIAYSIVFINSLLLHNNSKVDDRQVCVYVCTYVGMEGSLDLVEVSTSKNQPSQQHYSRGKRHEQDESVHTSTFVRIPPTVYRTPALRPSIGPGSSSRSYERVLYMSVTIYMI